MNGTFHPSSTFPEYGCTGSTSFTDQQNRKRSVRFQSTVSDESQLNKFILLYTTYTQLPSITINVRVSKLQPTGRRCISI